MTRAELLEQLLVEKNAPKPKPYHNPARDYDTELEVERAAARGRGQRLADDESETDE